MKIPNTKTQATNTKTSPYELRICELRIPRPKFQAPSSKYQGVGIACKWLDHIGKFGTW